MRFLELKMSSNHKMMRMRLREKRKLIEDEINGGKENSEVKYKENEDRIVGDEELGHHITDFSSEVGANCNDKTKQFHFSEWRREEESLVRRCLQ